MIKIFLNKNIEIQKILEIEKKRKRKKIYLTKINYNINKLMIINWIMGYLNKCGKKNWSFTILINIFLLLKKLKKGLLSSKNFLANLLDNLKQNVVLYNKKKGTLFYELPRFLNIIQSIKKIIGWLIKSLKNNKENVILSFFKEIKNIFYKKGEVLKKKQYIKDILKKNKPFFYLLQKKKRQKNISLLMI